MTAFALTAARLALVRIAAGDPDPVRLATAALGDMAVERGERRTCAPTVCPHCRLLFLNGGTCRLGGCPMGGDF